MRPIRGGPHKKSVGSSHNINLVHSLNYIEKRSQKARNSACGRKCDRRGRGLSPSNDLIYLGSRVRQIDPTRTQHDLHQESCCGESPSCSQQIDL